METCSNSKESEAVKMTIAKPKRKPRPKRGEVKAKVKVLIGVPTAQMRNAMENDRRVLGKGECPF